MPVGSGKTVVLLFVILFTVGDTFSNKFISNRIVFKNENDLLSHNAVKMACPDVGPLPVVKLLRFIASQYLTTCTTVIMYDEYFYQSLPFQPVIMDLLRTFPSPMVHGQFSSYDVAAHINTSILLSKREQLCTNYIILSQTPEIVAEMLGHQPQSKVVIVAQASKWKIKNFLKSSLSGQFVNLLVIADPTLQLDSFSEGRNLNDINMYTHELYADSLGSRVPIIVTAWRCNRLTRPWVNLFPDKMTNLNNYQIRIVGSEQPPYVYQSKENMALSVLADLSSHKADIAVAGLNANVDRIKLHHMSIIHSHDCAVFMTLASTALPKYRAIMGPFRWEVWMVITLAYLFAIIPISCSAHHSFHILIENPWEIENMFWYVFGTFTNCFTFTGHKSWTSGNMSSTRMFIGSYWLFSIIISAAYTGSIIAFIMLPNFPDVMNTAYQLLENDYTVIVTNNSGLKQTLYNSTDPSVLELSHDLEIMSSTEYAISNLTDPPFFTDYAFLHSRETLKHIIRTNLSQQFSHKKEGFYLSETCFVPMLVAIMFPADSILVERVNLFLQRAFQGGFLNKVTSDVAWDQQRSGTGKMLQVSMGGSKLPTPEERQLTLDDTQGMFLLLGAGFAIAIVAFIAECCGAPTKRACGHQSLVASSMMLSEYHSYPRVLSSSGSFSLVKITADVHVQENMSSFNKRKRNTQSLISMQAGQKTIAIRHPSV